MKLDDYHRHEALDRCHVINSMLCDHLLGHPFIEQNPDLRAKVEQAATLLSDVYQAIGLGPDDSEPNAEAAVKDASQAKGTE